MHETPRRWRLALVVALTIGSAGVAWLTAPTRSTSDGSGADGAPQRETGERSVPAAPGPREDGPLVLALAGDAAVSVPLDAGAAHLQDVRALFGRASLAIANFELAMTPLPDAPPGADTRSPAWPRAVPDAARALRALGIGGVSLANNHSLDAGADGLEVLQARLEDAGIGHTGAGRNLEAAREPLVLDTPQGRVALVSVALSFSPGARASMPQGDVLGRPGVNGLRYTRRLTVEGAAFARLQAAFPPAVFRQNPDGRSWDLHGLTVERGAVGGMRLAADPDDLAALSSSVRRGRAAADAVVVSVHAHEPGNRFDEVPDILREVAHAAVDAGADVVHGHGPHRLRAIEMYQGRPIFYSLGNLVFPDRALTPQAADAFEDHAANVLSGVAAPVPPVLDFSDDVWWQSAVALVQFDAGRVRRVEIHPIDLGVGQDIRIRGLPRRAPAAVAAAVLERLRRLSQPFGTAIAVDQTVGVIDR